MSAPGPVLCSTGAFVGRANGRDHRLIGVTWPRLKCDGLEFMMYGVWYPRADEIARELRATGIPFPAMHVDKDVGNLISRDGPGDAAAAFDAFRRNCNVAAAIGAGLLVLHLWGNADSDRHIARNYEALDRMLPVAAAYGLTLTVENVVCACADPMTRMAELCARREDAAFTVDTKMSAFHRQIGLFADPGWRGLWRRVKHLHINDYGGGYRDFTALRTLFLGEGHVDFDGFFAAAARAGYRGAFTCECTAVRPDGTIDLDRLNGSLMMARALRDRHFAAPAGGERHG